MVSSTPYASPPEVRDLNTRVAVDPAILAAYEEFQLAGEPDLIVELIDLYLEDLPRRLAVMRNSVADADWSAAQREAHSLRGSSGNLGAIHAALICESIELIEIPQLSSSLPELLRALDSELEQVRREFLALREQRTRAS